MVWLIFVDIIKRCCWSNSGEILKLKQNGAGAKMSPILKIVDTKVVINPAILQNFEHTKIANYLMYIEGMVDII